MRLAIRYRAEYRYDASASLSTHVLRLFPRPDPVLRIERQSFATVPDAQVQFRRDLFDNVVATGFFPDEMTALGIDLDLDLLVPERNPFDFLLEPRGLRIPCRYTPEEHHLLAPFLRPTQPTAWPEPLAVASRPMIEGLIGMNRWIADAIGYERREEGDPLPVGETLARGRGACRDVAVLMAEALRHNGIAARLVSGYLFEGDAADDDRRAAGAMHAWTEAYLPGAGWLGLDPTHGVLCDHCFIPVAVGLVPADIAPVSGTYFSDVPVRSTLSTSLAVTRI
ncbi:MAG: transglutaminase family protein [Planctomycetota bacterium]|jgi:transglutaminase-like putative cysteine protease|nr:transglutaminase family protein [Planctomycetota bacterium]